MALKSYEYRVICDVCRTKLYNYDLRLRWDGLMTCKDCWEPRHPLDFYRARSDAHLLPFTRSDVENELSWTPTQVGLTSVAASGETAVATASQVIPGMYKVQTASDNVNTAGITTGFACLLQFTDSNFTSLIMAQPKSVTTSTGGALTSLPTTPGGAGTARYYTNYQFLGIATIAAGVTTVTAPTWTSKPGHVFVSFQYLT